MPKIIYVVRRRLALTRAKHPHLHPAAELVFDAVKLDSVADVQRDPRSLVGETVGEPNLSLREINLVVWAAVASIAVRKYDGLQLCSGGFADRRTLRYRRLDVTVDEISLDARRALRCLHLIHSDSGERDGRKEDKKTRRWPSTSQSGQLTAPSRLDRIAAIGPTPRA
jgi:hypothetical protein